MKKLPVISLILALVVLLSACSDTPSPSVDTSFNAAQAVQYISENIKFDGKLQAQNDTYIKTLVGDCSYKDAFASAVGGTTPDMAVWFNSESSAQAEDIYNELDEYVSAMKDEYAKYAPEQVAKIDSSVLTIKGNRVVLCISSDNESAKSVIDSMWNKDISSVIAATQQDTTEPKTQSKETTANQEETTATKSGVEPKIAAVTDYESLGNIFRAGNACYECYYYNDEYASEYAQCVNSFVKKIPSTATVYDMLIPLGSAITLPDNLYDTIKSGNQKTAIDKVHAMLTDSIKSVDTYSTLREHRDEYIYFRTDHHWTAKGAYYAFAELCNAKGIKATALDSYKTKDFDGFLGTFYNDSGKNSKLKADTVTVYYPIHNDSITLKYKDTKGNIYEWPIIGDVSSYSASLKYSTFAAADNPFTVIRNSALKDGSVCVIIKESFGNAFVPFLSDIYQTVYEVDYRYCTDDVYKLINDHPNCDVILANNLSMLQSKYLQGKLTTLLG